MLKTYILIFVQGQQKIIMNGSNLRVLLVLKTSLQFKQLVQMDSLQKLKSPLTITHRNKGCPLPKTQPTKSSSQQIFSPHEPYNFYQVETCPQVSQFNIDDNLLYTHKLRIDYGHLQQPNHWPKKIKIKDGVDHQASQQTMRIQRPLDTNSNNKQTSYKEKNQQVHHKSVQALNRSTFIGQSSFKTMDRDQMNTSEKKQNPQAYHPKKTSVMKNQVKLKQVLAAKTVQAYKPQSQQSTQRNEGTRENSGGEKTQRRAQHCRIIRSYVGGSKMQIKIINYPDSSQYMKLCGHRN